MDENKRKKLHEIGYTIGPSCDTCVHFQAYSDENFGTCTKYKYQHLKHTGTERSLSVYKHGSCPQYQQQPGIDNIVHGFKEFIK